MHGFQQEFFKNFYMYIQTIGIRYAEFLLNNFIAKIVTYKYKRRIAIGV